MKNNLSKIEELLDYIEKHLHDDNLNLTTIAQNMGYSKYHLHRMFSIIVNQPMHKYIQHRRINEAAWQLIFTKKEILEISLSAGYESQRSFSRQFKQLYKHSPRVYRNKQVFQPIQSKYIINYKRDNKNIISNIKIIENNEIKLVGYQGNTRWGFKIIGKCWHQLHSNKNKILNQINNDFLIGVNDYSQFERIKEQKSFNYFAGAEVSEFSPIYKKMNKKVLPSSKYIIFSFKGKNSDSLEEFIDYIYCNWFSQSDYQFNENNCYDLVRYGEVVDEQGEGIIEYWVPIK